MLCLYDVDISPIFGIVTIGLLAYFALTRCESRHYPIILFLSSLIICLFAVVLFQNPPVSDFRTQYESALQYSAGNLSAYHTDYYLNWSWQTGWSLIESWLLSFWRSAACIKVFEAVCSSCMVVIAYQCATELFSRKTARFVSAALAFFPSFVLMCGVLSNQVLSALFCLLAIFVFITKKISFSKKWIIVRLFLCGTLLALAWFVRPDATVVLVALIPVVLISQSYSQWYEGVESILNRIFNLSVMLCAYLLVCSLLSFAVVASNLNPQGVSSHDPLIKLALGTNPDNSGSWSASLFERIQEKESSGMSYEDAELEVILENVSDPVRNVEILIGKNHQFWWDFMGFTMVDQKETNPQLVAWLHSIDKSMVLCCFILSLLALWGFTKRGFSDLRYSIFPSLVVFTVAAYQIVEAQPRYSYFILIIMFVLAGGGVEKIADFFSLIKAKTDENAKQIQLSE